MPILAQWAATPNQAGLALRRRFWKPLRNMMDIFHLLPLIAVAIIFVLLAANGQIRELYISYLEGPHQSYVGGRFVLTAESWALWIISITLGLAFVVVLSAVLFEAHYVLSNMRLKSVYSSYSNPASNSTMRALQRAAGFILAFLPWVVLTIGLFNARNFVAARYCQLQKVPSLPYEDMQHLWMPNAWTIAGALTVLGAATAWFCAGGDNRDGERLHHARRAVACCAPAVGVLLCVLISDWFDFGSEFEKWPDLTQPNSQRLAAIVAAIVALTVLYFWVYRALYRKRGAFIFSGTGVSLRKRRRLWFALWAFLPWLFAGVYFIWIQYVTAGAATATPWAGCPRAAAAFPRVGHWSAFPVAMCFTIALGLVVGHVLGGISDFARRRRAAVVVVGLLAAFVAIISLIDVNSAVTVYRFIGPFGTVMLQLVLLISALVLLAALSQRSGFPLLTLVILALIVALMFPSHLAATAVALGIVCLGVAAMALVSGRGVIAAMMLILPLVLGLHAWSLRDLKSEVQNPEPRADTKVKYQFSCWLSQRGIPLRGAADTSVQQDSKCQPAPSAASGRTGWPTGAKYPVFIVAVEGGGIYAASAASIFLSRLEDLEPRFDDHVFVVSGVSGGSIGAVVFQAMDCETHQDTARQGARGAGSRNKQTSPCAGNPATPKGVGKRSLESKATEVMEDDHLSPVIGSVFTEILGLPLNRADSLVASFEKSAAAEGEKVGQYLAAPFKDHWRPASFAPALALNATWVEMGFRTAFAPFALNDLDESLYSFTDHWMPDEDNVSLMQAAGVSARFPVFMPPFSAVMSDGQKRWNFVDGGYTDNSGATTALDIYKTIETVSPQNVDLRLILITSSIPQPNMEGNDIQGTVFGDALAPLEALMKVREDLGNEAIGNACTYVYHDDQLRKLPDAGPEGSTRATKSATPPAEINEGCIKHAGGKFSYLNLVEIEAQTLSLGWKISKTSFEVVSRMLGEPQIADKPGYCPNRDNQSTIVSQPDQSVAPPTASNPFAQISSNILQRNSCVMQTIIELVNGTLPDPVEDTASRAPQP